MNWKFAFISIAFIIFCSTCFKPFQQKSLTVSFNGKAQIEVGGPYVGVEFHHSYMIPQRISFYYPVANSIDLSQDYWKRDTSFVMEWFLKIGDKPQKSIGRQPAKFDLTPYSVKFYQEESSWDFSVTYQFCDAKPAMVMTYAIINRLPLKEIFELDTRLFTSLRTCQTSRTIEQAWTMYDSTQLALFTNFADADAQYAQVFVTNSGEPPVVVNSKYAKINDVAANLTPIPVIILQNKMEKPVAQFIYRRDLAPGDTLKIVQIIGSSKHNEGQELVSYLLKNYQQEIKRYEDKVLKKAYESSTLQTGNSQIDHSVAWAKAVMETNAHYLDGEIVPMPCPAEYNFYFTHDVLVTDLAAVNFDIKRVKRDLEYIARHADKNNVIPHAYYWKDGRYQTEYAGSDNWNNFWINIVAGSYFRHSADTALIEYLYPCLTKSLEQALSSKSADDLMCSNQPDWWDIGHNYGPRSYMTILAIKAIREYIYLSVSLGLNQNLVSAYASLADRMQRALINKLWNHEFNYLMNYNEDGTLDQHYYIGSLLAAHYGLLDNDLQNRLVQTAREKLLDEKVGIYNVYPMDFHLLGDFYKFVENEVGAQYYYANGGVWPQGNAWFALALIANDEKDRAAEFIDNTMSLHGIMNGPNGQPAYYEVRNANRNNPMEYGSVDKPQFLWAGAWYLYTLYHLLGVAENNWNISIDPFMAEGQKKCSFTLYVHGQPLLIEFNGCGKTIRSIKYDGKDFPSLLFPTDIVAKKVAIEAGTPKYPYLKSTSSILRNCTFTDKWLLINLIGYAHQTNQTIIISPVKPRQVLLNGNLLKNGWSVEQFNTYFKLTVNFRHTSTYDNLAVLF